MVWTRFDPSRGVKSHRGYGRDTVKASVFRIPVDTDLGLFVGAPLDPRSTGSYGETLQSHPALFHQHKTDNGLAMYDSWMESQYWMLNPTVSLAVALEIYDGGLPIDFSKLGNAAVYIVPHNSKHEWRYGEDSNTVQIYVIPLSLAAQMWRLELYTGSRYELAVDARLFWHWGVASVYTLPCLSGREPDPVRRRILQDLLLADRGEGQSINDLLRYPYHSGFIPLSGNLNIPNKTSQPCVPKQPRKHFIVHHGEVIAGDEGVCEGCPNALARSLRRCKPLVYNCIAGHHDEFRVDLSDSVKKRYEPHASACFGADNYKEIKECVAHKTFSLPVITNMLADESAIKEYADDRSDTARLGSITTRGYKWKCKHCLFDCDVKSNWSRNCTANPRLCGGPYFEQDYDRYRKALEPWEIHSLVKLTGSIVDTPLLKKYCLNWSRAKSRVAVISKPSSDKASAQYSSLHPLKKRTKRWLLTVPCTPPVYQTSYIPYTLGCKIRGVSPVRTFGQLYKTYPELKDVSSSTFFILMRMLSGDESMVYNTSQPTTIELRDDDVYVKSVIYGFSRRASTLIHLASLKNKVMLSQWRIGANNALQKMMEEPSLYRYDNNIQTWKRATHKWSYGDSVTAEEVCQRMLNSFRSTK
jgi:hypothetical protein